MKAQQSTDAYWTVRFAPYALAVAAIGLIVSLFWNRSRFSYLPMAALSGTLVFFFHYLRWRSGRGTFQLAAMASAFLPFFIVMARLHGMHGTQATQAFQYVAAFVFSYTALAVFLRRRIRSGLKQCG